jgi:hypothetical protein
MNGLGVEFSLVFGVPGSFSSFVSFLLLQSFCSSLVMGEILFFFSFSSSHSSRVVCEGNFEKCAFGVLVVTKKDSSLG